MRLQILLIVIVAWFPAFAATAAPLFESHLPLSLKLAGPLDKIIRDRPEKPEEQDMVLTLPDGRALDVKVRQRGNFRRQRKICRFPPLRLDFKKSQVDDTVFDEQNKLKLVTHCNKARRNQQYVFREYLAYRVFNLLTSASFKVRLVNIDYVDTFDKQTIKRYGFIIEPIDAVAERLRAEHKEPMSISHHSLDESAATLVEVFQYFIGNLDFSLIDAHADESCCHNVKLIQREADIYIPVPYDFDMSGLVDAPYAYPPAALAKEHRLRKVTDRLYRGFCREHSVLQQTLANFTEHRDSIYALIDVHGLLDKRHKRNVQRYIDRFFTNVDDAKSVDYNIVRQFRGC